MFCWDEALLRTTIVSSEANALIALFLPPHPLDFVLIIDGNIRYRAFLKTKKVRFLIHMCLDPNVLDKGI